MRIRSPFILPYRPRPAAAPVPVAALELLDLVVEARALLRQTEAAFALDAAALELPLHDLDPAVYALHHSRTADAVRRLTAWCPPPPARRGHRHRSPWPLRHTPVVYARLVDVVRQAVRAAECQRWTVLAARGEGSLAEAVVTAVEELCHLGGRRLALLREAAGHHPAVGALSRVTDVLGQVAGWHAPLPPGSREWRVRAGAAAEAARLALAAEQAFAIALAEPRALAEAPRLAALVAAVRPAAAEVLAAAARGGHPAGRP